MKVAFLCPINRGIDSSGAGAAEGKIAILAEELCKLGVEVTLMAVAGSKAPGRLIPIASRPLEQEPASNAADIVTMALCTAFSHAAGFDIIHNFMGVEALPFAGLTGVPMVSMWIREPDPAHAAIFRKFSKTSQFILEGEAPGDYTVKSAGLDDSDFFARVSVIRHGSAAETAKEYLNAYREILCRMENRRPWGHYENLVEGAGHKIKRITMAPGARLSLQKHQRRAERWTVISGRGVAAVDGKDIPLSPGETVYIPLGAAHRMANPGADPLVFAEVQLGDYFGEDDIIRLQDDYGR